MRILILDDSVDNLNLLRIYAKKSSHQFTMVAYPDEALSLLEKETFDMFFLDIQMPRMNGFEVLEKVRALSGGEELFVCALTAYTSRGEVEKIQVSSFNDYLQKPILREDFISYIDSSELKAVS